MNLYHDFFFRPSVEFINDVDQISYSTRCTVNSTVSVSIEINEACLFDTKFVETKLQKYYIIPEKPICFSKGDPYLSTTPNCRVHCSFDLLSNRQKVYSTKCLLTKYRAPELHTEICQQIYFYIY